MTREEANRRAAALSAGMSSAQIVAAFEMTDKLIEDGLSEQDRQHVCDARGWMIDALASRDELFLIGMEGAA